MKLKGDKGRPETKVSIPKTNILMTSEIKSEEMENFPPSLLFESL